MTSRLPSWSWASDDVLGARVGERTVSSEEKQQQQTGGSLSYGGRDRREPKKDPRQEWVRRSDGQLELFPFGR